MNHPNTAPMPAAQRRGPIDPQLFRTVPAARRWVLLLAVLSAVRTACTVAIGLIVGHVAADAIAHPGHASGPGTSLAGITVPGALAYYAVPLWGLAGLAFAEATLAWLATWLGELASARTMADMRSQALRRLALADPRAVDIPQWRVRLTTGVDGIGPYLTGFLPALAATTIATPALVAVVWFLDAPSAMIALITLPLIPLFMWLVGTLTQGRTERRLRDLGLLTDQLMDLVAGLPTLRAFGRHREPVSEIRRLARAHRLSTMAVLRLAFLSSMVLEFFATLSVALVAVGIGLRLLNGSLTMAVGLTVLIIIPEVYTPVRAVGTKFHDAQDGLVTLRELWELPAVSGDAELSLLSPADRDSAVPAEAGAVQGALGSPEDPRISGALGDPIWVDVSDVSVTGRDGFSPYQCNASALPGQVTVLAGPNGSGKSTLLLAILGIITEGVSGSVQVRSEQRTLPLAELWACTSYLPQRPVLDAEVVGDISGLSLGQRQQLAVARELNARRPLLMLDEPTAHLDQKNAERMMATLRKRAAEGATVVVASHDPVVLRAADSVFWVHSRRDKELGADTLGKQTLRNQRQYFDSGADVVAESCVEARFSEQSRFSGSSKPSKPSGFSGFSEYVLVTETAGTAQAATTAASAARFSSPATGNAAQADAELQPSLRGFHSFWGMLTQLRPLTGLHRTALIGPIAAGSATILSSLALTVVSAWLITRAWEMPPLVSLSVAITSVRALGISRAGFRYVDRLASHGLALRCAERARAALASRLAGLPTSQLMSMPRGALLTRIGSDVDAVADVIVRAVLPGSVALVTTVLTTAFVWILSASAAAAVAVGLVVAGACAAYFTARSVESSETARSQAIESFIGAIDSTLTTSVVCRIRGTISRSLASADIAARALARAQLSGARSLAAGSAISTGARTLTELAVLMCVISGLTTSPGAHSAQWAGVLVLLPLAAFEAVQAMPSAAQAAVRARGAHARLAQLASPARATADSASPMATGARAHVTDADPDAGTETSATSADAHTMPAPTAQTPYDCTAPETAHPHLTCQNLAIGRAEDLPLSPEIQQLDVPFGARVAIVGPSGSGKTTLLLTLAGLLPPRAGEIYVDGKIAAQGPQPSANSGGHTDVSAESNSGEHTDAAAEPARTTSEKSSSTSNNANESPLRTDDSPRTIPDLRALVAYSAEDAHIFATTVRDNLAVGNAAATEHDMLAVMEAVGLGPWLGGLPRGLDSILHCGSGSLSGGQRRRLLLARALLTTAPILLLDEPTEHIDADSADKLTQLLASPTLPGVRPQRTVIVVAHPR